MKVFTNFFIFFFILFSFAANSQLKESSPTSTYLAKTNKSHGLFIVLHGLNLRPNKMNKIISFLNSHSYDVILLRLTGHRNISKERFKVSQEVWLDDFNLAYLKAKKHLENKKKPLYFLGYSLGAIIANAYQSINKKIIFKKQILLAPPFKTNNIAKTPLFLFKLFPTMSLPSLSIKEYRSFHSTPLKSYKVLFDLKKKINFRIIKDLKTLVFLSKEDELINFSETSKIIKENFARNWQFEVLDTRNQKLSKRINHLIIDERSMGEGPWKIFQAKLLKFLESSKNPL